MTKSTMQTKAKSIIEWCTKNRNLLFLEVCLAIHAIYIFVFSSMGIWFLAILNIFSCGFYADWLFILKDTSEKSMLYTYFEIVFFSVLSELTLGPDYGFFLYIVGMTTALFYLIPSYGNKRFVIQIIGVVIALLLEGGIRLTGIRFPLDVEALEPYKVTFYLINLLIMALIVLAATFFYSHETERVWESLRYTTNHDALTGLYNRRYLEKQIEDTPPHKRTKYVISMVDIDFFKKVNDTYGHEAGDAVLVKVAACLMETAGKDNLAVRWGGEEFILYFPKATTDQIYPAMEELRKKIEQMSVVSGRNMIRVTITSGISGGLEDSNYEKVIKNADEKLYLGKQRGRNQVVV